MLVGCKAVHLSPLSHHGSPPPPLSQCATGFVHFVFVLLYFVFVYFCICIFEFVYLTHWNIIGTTPTFLNLCNVVFKLARSSNCH